MHKITRIAYNSAGWQRPAGEARQSEGGDHYNAEHFCGHEAWWFRSKWMIDDQRYASFQRIMRGNGPLATFIGCLFGLLLFPPTVCFGTDDGFGVSTLSRGLAMPIRSAKGETKAKLRVERIFSESEKRGFLRIGVVSHLVCDGVAIELQSSRDAEVWLQGFSERLRVGHELRRGLELRRVRIVSVESPDWYFDCVLARPQADGTWKLSDVHWSDRGRAPQHLSDATLVSTPDGLQLEQGQRCWCVDPSQPTLPKI